MKLKEKVALVTGGSRGQLDARGVSKPPVFSSGNCYHLHRGISCPADEGSASDIECAGAGCRVSVA